MTSQFLCLLLQAMLHRQRDQIPPIMLDNSQPEPVAPPPTQQQTRPQFSKPSTQQPAFNQPPHSQAGFGGPRPQMSFQDSDMDLRMGPRGGLSPENDLNEINLP